MQSQHITTVKSFEGIFGDFKATRPDLQIKFKQATLDEIELYLSSNIIPLFKLDKLKERVEFFRSSLIRADKQEQLKNFAKIEQLGRIDKILFLLDADRKIHKRAQRNSLPVASAPLPLANMEPSHFHLLYLLNDIFSEMLKSLSFDDAQSLRSTSKTVRKFMNNLQIENNYIIVKNLFAVRTVSLEKFMSEEMDRVALKHLTYNEFKPYVTSLLNQQPDFMVQFEEEYVNETLSDKMQPIREFTYNNGEGIYLTVCFTGMALLVIGMMTGVATEKRNSTEPVNFSIPTNQTDYGKILFMAGPTGIAVIGVIAFLIYTACYAKKTHEATRRGRNLFGMFKQENEQDNEIELSVQNESTSLLKSSPARYGT